MTNKHCCVVWLNKCAGVVLSATRCQGVENFRLKLNQSVIFLKAAWVTSSNISQRQFLLRRRTFLPQAVSPVSCAPGPVRESVKYLQSPHILFNLQQKISECNFCLINLHIWCESIWPSLAGRQAGRPDTPRPGLVQGGRSDCSHSVRSQLSGD